MRILLFRVLYSGPLFSETTIEAFVWGVGILGGLRVGEKFEMARSEAFRGLNLPLVSREWKNGSNSSYNCTPFLHSLLTKGM